MKVLYGVQGAGNGHITRARLLTLAMKASGIDIDLVFSGRNGRYVDMDEFGAFETYRGLTFYSDRGRINRSRTIANLALWKFYNDCCQLDLSQYDLVLNDFEPVTAWSARMQGVPIVSISHQAAFSQSIPTSGTRFGTRQFMQYFAPSDQQVGVHWYHFNQAILPPMVESFEPSVGDRKLVLVYLPFEDLNEVVRLLQRFNHIKFVCFHPQATDQAKGNVELRSLDRVGFLRVLNACGGVFCNSGFELPSEAMVAGKKLLVKPLRGQFEQLSNALALELLALGSVTRDLCPMRLDTWLGLDNAEPLYFPDVPVALSEWVLQGRSASIECLKNQLWQQVSFPLEAQSRIMDLPQFNKNWLDLKGLKGSVGGGGSHAFY